MSGNDTERLFEVLDPPPGGLTRLRARVRGDRRRRIRNRSMVAMAASLAVVVLAVIPLLPPSGNSKMLTGFESDLMAIRLGLVDAPTEAVSIRPDLRRQYAVREVPTTDERVVFYMVGSR